MCVFQLWHYFTWEDVALRKEWNCEGKGSQVITTETQSVRREKKEQRKGVRRMAAESGWGGVLEKVYLCGALHVQNQ